MPRCSAIVVTHNSADSITACLEALAVQNCEIVVVDNASHDDTVARTSAIAQKHRLELLRISRNLGFAGGVNHGVQAASGDVLLLLNPDAVAEPGAVSALVDCVENTGSAALGGALLDQNGAPAKGFTFRRLPTLSSLLCEVLLVNQLWADNPVNRKYRCLDADYDRQQEIEQPAGACLAVSRNAWDKLGGMDTQFYPVWFEDVDLCKRLRDAGQRIVYCPQARFRHSGAHSVRKLSFNDKQLFWYSNMLRYANKHFPPWKVLILRWGIVKGVCLRWLAAVVGKGPMDVPSSEARAAYTKVMRLGLGLRIPGH